MQNYKRAGAALLAVILLSEIAFSKTNLNDWNNVRILETGSTLVVKTKLGETYEGTLEATTVNSLSIVVKVPHVMRRVIDLRRDEIKEVRTKLARVASTAIGGGIGLGIGIGLGAIADSKDKYGEDPGLGKITFGFLGALFGSLLGGGLGFGSRQIYETP
jgi:hypothetical protein